MNNFIFNAAVLNYKTYDFRNISIISLSSLLRKRIVNILITRFCVCVKAFYKRKFRNWFLLYRSPGIAFKNTGY